jgi:hypothetical protein
MSTSPVTEGRPFTRAAISGGVSLGGLTLGAGWVATFLEVSGKLTEQVQVVVLVAVGLIVLTAEIGLILIVLQYMRSTAALDRRLFGKETETLSELRKMVEGVVQRQALAEPPSK